MGTEEQRGAGPGRKNDGEIEIDLLELLMAFRKKLLSILLAGVIGLLVGYACSRFLITPLYTSTSMMYVVGSDSVIQSLADLQIGTQLTQDYQVMIKNRGVMEKVIQDLQLPFGYKDLRRKIKVSNPQGTRILEIRVDDSDPVRVKQIADTVARASSDYIAEIMEQDPPKIIEEGEIPTEKTSPSNARNALIAAMLAMLAVMGLITFRYVMDDTIKTEEDIRNYFGVTVLAVVPLHEEEEQGKHHHHHRKTKDAETRTAGKEEAQK